MGNWCRGECTACCAVEELFLNVLARQKSFCWQKSFLSIHSFFPILDPFETDELSTLHVWLQRPRGIALIRAGFKSVVCQPAIERDA